MSHESDMLSEIERHEDWLKGVMPADERRSLEFVKLRVRVAVHETWLAREAAAGEARPESGAPDLSRLKQAVRSKMAAARGRRSYVRYAGFGLSAAAALLLAAIVLRPFAPRSRDSIATPVPPGLGDLADVLQASAASSDTTAAVYVELEAEILTLDASLALVGQLFSNDEAFQDLYGDVELLVEQIRRGS